MFIDSSREAMDVIKENVKKTGFESKCKYLVSDSRNYIRKASGREVFDLVFIDPPYALLCCTDVIRKLIAADLLADGAIIVSESGEESLNPEDFPELEVTKAKRYGKKTEINIFLYHKSK